MSRWFGKNCKYLAASWEDSEEVAGPDWKEVEPVLVFCNHPKNEGKCEGNCNPNQCPLGYTLDSFMNDFELKDPLPGTMFSLWKDSIHKMLIESKGQCNSIEIKNKDTLCPCKEYRKNLVCKCDLYVFDN